MDLGLSSTDAPINISKGRRKKETERKGSAYRTDERSTNMTQEQVVENYPLVPFERDNKSIVIKIPIVVLETACSSLLNTRGAASKKGRNDEGRWSMTLDWEGRK